MNLDSERWARIEQVFGRALERPAAERLALVRLACGEDHALCRELEAMLAAGEDARSLSIERLVVDDDPDQARPGAAIGVWRTLHLLGRGSGGSVYLAERADGQYEQRAALKLIAANPASAALADRLRAERQILARLVHPNIARLIDGGVSTEGTPYLVMEYVDGTSLTTYCDDRQLGIEARLRLFQVVCHAVQHAHRSLVVHRDLKPSNIYVSSAGEVKLLDFGIAKLVEPDDSGWQTPATRTEFRALTPAYAAPEQMRGEPVTTAADVYALGVVLYELLAGRRPLEVGGLSPAEAERLVATTAPAPPSAVTTLPRVARRLRGDLDRICLMALRKEPERRYGSPGQLAEDIDRYLTDRPVVAQPDSIGYRMSRFVARNRAAVAAAAVFAALVSLFAAVATRQARSVAAERDRARLARDRAEEVVRLLVDLFQAANPEVVPGGDRQTIAEFMSAAEPKVLRELENRPEVRSTMQHVLGRIHSSRSDYPRARALLEDALRESRRVNGDDAIETITMEVDLGALLNMLRDAEAGGLLEDAAVRSERVAGARHPLTGRALFALAASRRQDDQQARPLYERALAIRRAAQPPDQLEIANTLTALGVIEMNENRYAAAERRFDEAVDAAGAVNGGRNAAMHEAISDLATLRARLGDYARAETLQRRALALAVDLIGPRSDQAATDVNNLAVTVITEGRLDAGLDLLHDAYDRYVEMVGPLHWRTANAARNVGVVMTLLERYGDARMWLERAVRGSEAAEGAGGQTTTYIRAQLANTMVFAGERQAGLEMLAACVNRLRELDPEESHYSLADARLYFARALLASGRPQEAEAALRAVRAFRDRVLPAGHRQRFEAACELGRAVAAQHRPAEARTLLEGCVTQIKDNPLVPRTVREATVTLLDTLQISR